MASTAEIVARRHTTYVAGAKFRPQAEQVHLAGLEPGAPLALEPEPTNQYDPHAIKIVHDGHHVGYVPRDLSQEVSALIATGRLMRCVKGTGARIEIHYSEETQ